MDSFYPVQNAIDWSERLCREDAPLIKTGVAFPAAVLNVETVTIKELNNGQIAKAMFPSAGAHRQEAVFTVVGALKAKDLPPVRGSNLRSERIQFARQHATLTGWDVSCFKQALDNMQEVGYTMFSAFAEGAVEPWRPEQTDEQGAVISSNCRYFTVGRNIPPDTRTTFHRRTDPHGVLHNFVQFGTGCDP
ncbi:hypothetical protein B0H14DRAFT_3486931 [Mycena olivaceomarginata]|nr:hypothetical protein B0H14DRAFT_3486931 [Mycena olivaceomarginata]